MAGVILDSVSDTEPQYFAQLRSEGDALQQATNSCSKESVSETTHRICRHCDVTSPQRGLIAEFLDSHSCPFTLTTANSHVRDMRIVKANPNLSKWLGVTNKTTAFDGVPFYDVTIGAPGDVTMHTFVTVGLLELNPLLRYLFKSDRHALNLHSFNRALRDDLRWLPKDKHHIPSTQSETAFTGDRHILWTSAQTICFILHSELLLSEHVDVSDPRWQCWLLHAEYIKLANAPRFSWETLKGLSDKIIEHHTLYLLLYPGKIIPKWHYEFHAVLQILYHGNLRDHACWTGESCLRLFKRWSERITSCRNPLRFITERYSRKIALDKKMKVTMPVTYGEHLICEEPLDADSILGKLLHSCTSTDIPGYMPMVSWFKRMKHLSDTAEIGMWFMSDSPNGIVLSVIGGLIGCCGECFFMHRKYLDTFKYDEHGNYVLCSSLQEQEFTLNLKVELVSFVSTEVTNDRIYS